MPQGHSHETTELKLLFLNEGADRGKAEALPFTQSSIPAPQS